MDAHDENCVKIKGLVRKNFDIGYYIVEESQPCRVWKTFLYKILTLSHDFVLDVTESDMRLRV